MSIEYVDLVDYIAIAAEVTGLRLDTIVALPNLPLAESALHAPAAGFGEQEFYPDFIDKAAVLITRLARNHPLPDGNKRAAWVALRLFIEQRLVVEPDALGRRSRTRCSCENRRRLDRATDRSLATRASHGTGPAINPAAHHETPPDVLPGARARAA